jgi:NADH-quinone oxidoreductase subunit K
MTIYLILSCGIFLIGVCGIFSYRKHLIYILICFELLILAINIIFISASIFMDSLDGQLFSLCILAIAAAESALGLIFIINFYKIRGGISIDLIKLLKV